MSETLRILLVEDNPADTDLIRDMLPQIGPNRFQLETVTRLSEALLRLRDTGIDLVLADLGLPDSQGLQTLRQLHQAAPNVPLIVLTGTDDRELGVAAVHEHAQDYLIKGQVNENLLVRSAQHAVERHKAAGALREGEMFKQAILDSVPSQIAVLDCHGIIMAVNARWQRFALENPPLGGEPARNVGVGVNYLEVCRASFGESAEGAMTAHEGILRVIEGRSTSFFMEYPCHAPQEQRWFSMSVTPLGKENSVVVSHSNITERKLAEKSLAASERRYRRLFELESDAIILGDRETHRILDVNQSAQRLYGYTREEFIQLMLEDVSAEPEKSRLSVDSDDVHVPLRYHRKKNGERFAVEINSNVIEYQGRQARLAAVRDITVRQQIFDKLRETTGQLLQAQRIAQLGSYDFDFKTGAWTSSEVLDELFGIVDPAFRKDLAGWLQIVHPLDRAEMQRYFQDEVLSRRNDFDRKYRIVRLKDQQERWVHGLGKLVLDDQGKVVRMSGVIQDFTESKLAEAGKARLEAQLLQAQKMESVGQLAGGVAHDFNNMLAATMMNLSLLQRNNDLSPEIQEIIKELIQGAERAANLTRQLLMFSRRSVMEVKLLDLNELVTNLLKMLGRLIGEHIIVRFGRREGLPCFEGDSGMIEQAIMNLAINARDAMPKGGEINLGIEAIQVELPQVNSQPGVQSGQFLCLSVADNGCGMDEATCQRVFEPFFTTKGPGKGTGLGLATVHGIAAQHKGWVEVKSEVGKGTTFKVFLPASAKTITKVMPAGKMAAVRGHETILVVEDEADLRRLVSRSLRFMGYAVFEAENGQAALKLWQERRGQFDLLFSDMVMPEGLTGLDLAEQLRQQKPGLKVIISSGYSTETAGDSTLAARGVIYLQKPYRVEFLSKAVRDCLDGKG